MTITNPKTGQTLESPFQDNNEAFYALNDLIMQNRLSDRDASFAGDLLIKGEKYGLTSGQWFWVHKLAMPPKQHNLFDHKPVTEVGHYMLDGVVYRVRPARESNHLYAVRLEGTKWVYAKGIMSRLSATNKLSLEEAAAYGQATGVCAVCGRLLTDPDSIARGIGPICLSKL